MAWLMVVVAGFLEVGLALSLKASHGFTRLLPIIGVALFGGGSFALLNLAIKSLPVGPAYAIWTGLGAAGTAAVSILVLGEAATLLRVASITLVVIGVVGLGLSGSGH